MATFTMQLKEVLERLYGATMDPDDYEVERGSFTFNGVTYDDLPILPDNGAAFGMAQYPIFNEDYRPIINGKIVDQFYNREIGMETIDDFKLVMRRTLQQIMPYYNKLYDAENIEYGALQTMDIHSVSESVLDGSETSTATNTAESGTKSKARAVQSSTPQTFLAGNGDYATGASDTNSESEANSGATNSMESNSDTNTNSDNRVTGWQGIASDLIMRYRNSLINVDNMVINNPELQTCFMLLLNNGDSYSPNRFHYGWMY